MLRLTKDMTLPREKAPQVVQNPIQALRRGLAETQDTLAALENKYYWLKGWGTGWRAAHYGISDAEWDAIYAEHTALRARVSTLRANLGVLRKQAGRRISILAHGG